MRFNYLSEDTICAIASAHGMGAVALVRISGSKSLEVISSIFKPKNKKIDIQTAESHHLYFGAIHDAESEIDEVLVSIFRAPHSYTGEDAAEISCHGSVYIQQRLIELLIEKGCRMAEPGEFTMRAFANGRFDLAQAEAVADLIASQSESAHRIAMKQMRGGFSAKIKDLRRQLIDFSSLIELELDFAEEDVEFADRKAFLNLIEALKKEINGLIDSFKAGNVIKNGIPVAIVGKPNVGKSTLLNAILNEEKAIVSEIPGTTRDAIEDTIVIGGYSFRFIDTAGLRDSDDTIENMGIERTYQKIDQAAVILYVCDLTTFTKETTIEILDEFRSHIDDENKHFILVVNKADLMEEIPSHFAEFVELETVFVSAKRKENIHLIADSLVNAVKKLNLNTDAIVSNARHYQALKESLTAIESVEKGFQSGLPTDLAGIDIRLALYHLGTITGEITNEEVLGNIFGKFCIGK
ncbi:MAG: tRNA uridine-5-carboxymethylaminomethyl(34) synthesis GTPase MnmE [Bacteroidales bacterium]|nr:tRNA uridine-5-carboxymethylaminomethyl(34) synthesis GTPase MnmE [Bacteroidales bacterium]